MLMLGMNKCFLLKQYSQEKIIIVISVISKYEWMVSQIVIKETSELINDLEEEGALNNITH